MKRTSLAILHVWLGLMASALPLPAQGGQAAGEARWRTINLEGEELSIQAPVAPTVIVQAGDNLFYPRSGEKILEQRKYSAYHDGFIYAVDSYKVKEPQKFLGDVLKGVPEHHRFERDIKLDGYTGKKYDSSNELHQREVYYLAASEHVYVVTLAARDKADPSPARFFSAVRLGGKRSAAAAKPPGPEPARQAPVAGAAEQDKTYSPREVTHKARIVWRPEPIYTETARRNEVTGTVVIRAVFTSGGQVTNIRVVSGLGDGLTENSVEAARSIRFFPAVKDGRLVSQYIQIEYNFNLF